MQKLTDGDLKRDAHFRGSTRTAFGLDKPMNWSRIASPSTGLLKRKTRNDGEKVAAGYRDNIYLYIYILFI
jgi:hypothetical protein